jgi:hypothetical protein
MPSERRPKDRRGKDQKQTGRPLLLARKRAKRTPDEELGPERRAELAQEAEAKQSRGKPPSI